MTSETLCDLMFICLYPFEYNFEGLGEASLVREMGVPIRTAVVQVFLFYYFLPYFFLKNWLEEFTI